MEQTPLSSVSPSTAMYTNTRRKRSRRPSLVFQKHHRSTRAVYVILNALIPGAAIDRKSAFLELQGISELSSSHRYLLHCLFLYYRCCFMVPHDGQQRPRSVGRSWPADPVSHRQGPNEEGLHRFLLNLRRHRVCDGCAHTSVLFRPRVASGQDRALLRPTGG